MRVLYIARHEEFDNSDEKAIAHALTKLGHEVTCVHEKLRHRNAGDDDRLGDTCYDFALFHKMDDISTLRKVRVPKAFWYFDLVDSDDSSLKPRCRSRIEWFNRVLPYCKLGFLTDGDYVRHDKTGKLHWLVQGADERVVGFGTPLVYEKDTPSTVTDILFMGMVNHGRKRASHIDELKERYGSRFTVLGDGGPKYRLHGRDLADLIASVKIVIAPDGPCTDNYWSNRVYLTLGFGGFLLHPYCTGLSEFYDNSYGSEAMEGYPAELLVYKDRPHCNFLIDRYLSDDFSQERRRLAENGYRATLERNLYRHRCEDLIREVEKVL